MSQLRVEGQQDVVPVAVNVVTYQGYRGDVFVGVADAGGVVVGVQDGAHAETGRGGRVGDQIDEDLVAGRRSASLV